jgi:hypothetical protein
MSREVFRDPCQPGVVYGRSHGKPELVRQRDHRRVGTENIADKIAKSERLGA